MMRLVYLATAALMIPALSALVQDGVPAGDDDPYLPEQNMVVVEHEELERIVGQQLPKSVSPNLMDTSVILVVSLLLIGSSALIYAVLKQR